MLLPLVTSSVCRTSAGRFLRLDLRSAPSPPPPPPLGVPTDDAPASAPHQPAPVTRPPIAGWRFPLKPGAQCSGCLRTLFPILTASHSPFRLVTPPLSYDSLSTQAEGVDVDVRGETKSSGLSMLGIYLHVSPTSDIEYTR